MVFYLPTRTYDNVDLFQNDLGTCLFFTFLFINSFLVKPDGAPINC